MPTVLWRFYYQWYLNLVTIVRVNDVYGSPFKVTRGIRQGSKVSPLFLMFLLMSCYLNFSHVTLESELLMTLLIMLHMLTIR